MLHVAPSCLVPDEPHAPPPCSGDKGTPADPDDGEKGARGGGEAKCATALQGRTAHVTAAVLHHQGEESGEGVDKEWRTEGETWLRLPSDGENECAH
jgi:hypothetical protein